MVYSLFRQFSVNLTLPQICVKRFSARFPTKREDDGSLYWSVVVEMIKHYIIGKCVFILKMQIFHKMNDDLKGLMRPLLFYGEVAQFLKTVKSFDQITTLIYVLIDNFCPCFLNFLKDFNYWVRSLMQSLTLGMMVLLYFSLHKNKDKSCPMWPLMNFEVIYFFLWNCIFIIFRKGVVLKA